MIDIQPSVAAELPVDELGLLVLADLVATREWNEYNYLLLYENDEAWRGHTHVLAEATAWLRAHALVARNPRQSASEAIVVTRRGHELLKMQPSEVRSYLQLEVDLHPLLQRRVRRQFLLGEYENAIFTAMRAVEVRVRELSGLPDSLIGRDLMQQAFGKQGPLTDPAVDRGEAESTLMFFSGAYGILRNPSGHREVSFDDVNEAVEAVMTVSLLMRILDRAEQRLNGPAPRPSSA